jgi:hypothetical protein
MYLIINLWSINMGDDAGFEVLTAVIMRHSIVCHYAIYSDESLPKFRRNMWPPCSEAASCWILLTMNIEATCPSEMSLKFHWVTRRHIPESP